MAKEQAAAEDLSAFPREDARRLRRGLLVHVGIKDVAGIWKGKLVDVLGLDGELELILELTKDGGVSGRFQMRLRHTHSVQEAEGPVRGKVSGSKIELVHKGPQDMGFRFLGQLVPTGRRSRRMSMVGCYELDSQARPGFAPLRAGTMMLWKG